jgi:long-chain acyl-CoA synthetase
MFSYTSGTTGNPKAVMLTHRMILAVIAASRGSGVVITMKDTFISYLPLAHSMEQCFIAYTELIGGKYGFYSGDPLKLVDDCIELKPTVFASVPRLFNKMYDKIMAGVKDKSEKQQKTFNDAVEKKKRALRTFGIYKDGLWDKLIFSKIQARLGGRVRIMVTASAPISVDVLEFLKVGFCCPILEGYG